MGERMTCHLIIGGDPGEHREELLSLIATELGVDLTDDSCEEFESQAGLESEGPEGLELFFNEAQPAEFGTVTAWLREHGLSYNLWYEAKWEYNGVCQLWRPGLVEELSHYCLQDGQPVVLLKDLLDLYEEGYGTLLRAIEKLSPPELPTWVMRPETLSD